MNSEKMPQKFSRDMTREQYYKGRSQVRRMKHIIKLRYANAYIHYDSCGETTVIIPSIAEVLPEKFK